MSILFDLSGDVARRGETRRREATEASGEGATGFDPDHTVRRPALLEEKLKLHARIIDEFNLVLLEKLPRAELVRQVRCRQTRHRRTFRS